ncbi:MAG TPA: pirin-like C-terminal cupin domain-containing protein [Pyrinomonadaceae bacterium]|nr:pirin-like C-terminal cupin domain-containing protein [Pyrinomonadaceae bacterium]
MRDCDLSVVGRDGAQGFSRSRRKYEAEVLLIAGVPLNEPIARYGPFVMNTQAEIRQAIEDYQQGRMGATST